MKTRSLSILVPVIGYLGLWVLGSTLFLLYFYAFKIPMQSDYAQMIRGLPTTLAIATVPVCSFVSFYFTARILGAVMKVRPTAGECAAVAASALIFTVAMDLVTTVLAAKMNILTFPLNLMYLLAWAVIVPAVLVGLRRSSSPKSQ